LIAARDPNSNVQKLQKKHKFKLKGVGSLTYHLGCNYYHDMDCALCYGPRKYIDKLMGEYENMFGCKPREYTSPLEKGDHPEVDFSDELDYKGIKRYQTMIGCLQWDVSLGRFDTWLHLTVYGSGFTPVFRLQETHAHLIYISKKNTSQF
jgi:hypothetical protein